MHLCFVDESGTPAKPGATSQRYFVIGGLIIPEERWHGITKKLQGLKTRSAYHGELKWRYFAPSNADPANPMGSWTQDKRNQFREDVFGIITSDKSVRIVAGVCDAPLAYTLGNVNAQDDIYFRTYKVVTERFQYFLQDVSRNSGRSTLGMVVADHRGRGDDQKLRQQHQRLIDEEGALSSNYNNLVEGLFFAPSRT